MLDVDVLTRLIAAIQHKQRFIVAYSGGLDSHALLYWLVQHRSCVYPLPLSAVYVDHGLQPQSAHWGQHCARICQALNVPFQTVKVNAQPQPRESPEQAARRARYKGFESILSAGSVLLSAQHKDDQAETLLLQLMRGAGPQGLAAMPWSKPLGPGVLLRPLLHTDRAAILAYAQAQGLQWIEDPSNQDRHFDRNFIRHEVLPLLKQRWPSAPSSLSRSAELCAQAVEINRSVSDDDITFCSDGSKKPLRLSRLRTLPLSRQQHALRRWLQRLELPLPSRAQLQQAIAAVQSSGKGQPLIRWRGAEVRCFRDRIYALPPPART